MIYKCLDCSHEGSYFPDGACPGCGSLNIRRLKTTGGKPLPARKPYRAMFALALWVYLVLEIMKIVLE